MTFVLHYAPDNASLCVRLALHELDLRFETRLVDRSVRAQDSAAYRRLNPHGLIPALATPEGPVFETAAILLWLADREGQMMPSPRDPDRGRALSWLFWLSNTLHPALRVLFYPEQHVAPEGIAALSAATRGRIAEMLDRLERSDAPIGGAEPTILDCYLCPMLRWPALYPPGEGGWFDLSRWPRLHAVAAAMEGRASTRAAMLAEGLGPTPFTAPRLPDPPEGSPL